VGRPESLSAPRLDEQLLLSIEHRAAPSQSWPSLALRAGDKALALAIVDATPVLQPPPPSPLAKLEDVLAHTDHPLMVAELRLACRIRTAFVCRALAALTATGRVHKTAAGYQLAMPAPVSRDPFLASLSPTGETETGNADLSHPRTRIAVSADTVNAIG
jgi:hypothetical protein